MSTPGTSAVRARQGGRWFKGSAELRREIAQVERALAGLRQALWEAELREKVQEVSQ